MFVQDQASARRFFVEAWRKHCERLPLEPLEAMVADVVALHPEYHPLLAAADAAVDAEFAPERGATNPFLHMGMHLALREQVGADRPRGIAPLYNRILGESDDGHTAEHAMMECLGEALWSAQREQRLPDEYAYIECLRRRLRS